MKESARVVWVFTIYSLLLIVLSLGVYALFPYLPSGLLVSHYYLEALLYEGVNIITNTFLTLFFVKDMIERKDCPRVFMWILSILISALFVVFITAMLQKRPEKKGKGWSLFN